MLEVHDGWQFADMISQTLDKTLEYGARNGSCSNICLWKSPLEMLSFERRIETMAEGRELYPVHKLVDSRTFSVALSLLGALMLSTFWISHLWSMLFACLLLFCCFSSSHFCLDRPFGFSIHRGINSFHCPCFCLNRLWRLSIQRGAHFCLSRPFGFSA